MTIKNTIPEIDYTTKDFLSIQDQMVRYVQTHFGGRITNFNESSQTMMLIELAALYGDILFFYFDRQANESFLPTATRRQSVIDLCSTLDYHLSGGSPATGIASFTINPTDQSFPGYPAIIPARFAISNGKSGTEYRQYETDSPLIFLATETTKQVSISEGRTVNESGSNLIGKSNGSASQSFVLSQTSVHLPSDIETFNRVFQLSVGGVAWTKVLDFVDSGPTDQHYVLTVDELDQISIHFGDGVLGKIPPNAEEIEATYRVVSGLSGQVGATILTKIVNSSLPWVISVTNTLQTTGGTDRETIEQAKINAPRSLRSLYRAVSDEDHETIALSVEGVAKAKTGLSSGLEIPIFIAPVGGGSPSASLINQVVSVFQNKKMSPTRIRVLPPFYQLVDLTYELHVSDGYKQSDVKAQVDQVLSNLFSFDQVDFGTGAKLVDLYDGVKNVVTGMKSFLIKKLTLSPLMRKHPLNTGTPLFSNLKVNPNVTRREWKIQMTSNTTFSVSSREYGVSSNVSGKVLSDLNASWLITSGTATASGNVLTDNSQNFEVGELLGNTLIDSSGASFLISANTISTISVSSGVLAAGTYKVVRRFNGKTLNPDVTQSLTFSITSNTENSIEALQDITSATVVGHEYYIETLQTNTGTLNGGVYEDDQKMVTFKMSSGAIAPTTGDSWVFHTTGYIDDISTPKDVIPEQGVFLSRVFGGKT